LEQKAAANCSFSVVDHLRWDLRAIFRLAAQDRLLHSNPAEMLFTPPTVATPSRRVLTPEQVQQILQVLPVREQSRKRRTIHYFDSEEHTPAPERSIRSIRLR